MRQFLSNLGMRIEFPSLSTQLYSCAEEFVLGKKGASACMSHALCGVSERIAAFTATDNGNEKKEEEQRRMVLLLRIGVHSTNMALADPPA